VLILGTGPVSKKKKRKKMKGYIEFIEEGVVQKHIDAEQERRGHIEYHRRLKKDYPDGVDTYHESHPDSEASIRKHGLDSEHTTDEHPYGWHGSFHSIGQHSNFRTGRKLRVHVRIPHTHSHHLVPDMTGHYDIDKPHHDVLQKHGGVKGSWAYYPHHIPKHWIKHIETVGKDE
jgi:hypothetical protein